MVGGTRLLYSLPAYGIISIAALLSLASLRAKRPSADAFCILSTLLLGAWILGRAWYSPIEYLAQPDFFMMIGCLMVYLLTAQYLTGPRGQTAMIILLWVIACAEVWVGVVQFTKDPGYMLFGLMRPPGNRASGLYISPNNFAGYLVTVAVISASLGIWSRWRVWAKVLAFYIAAACLVGVAISGSRGGYFATIGSLAALVTGSMYVIRIADPRKFVPVAIAGVCGLLAVLGLAAFLMMNSGFLQHRMQTMVVKDVRIYNWEAAIDNIRVSPWIGTGAGTHLIYGRLFRRPPIQVDPVHAHCDYLELLAEYGIAGGVCMALFLTAHIRKALRTFSEILRERMLASGFHRSNSFAIQFGALCAVAGLGIHSVVDFDMHIPGNALIFAFLFGIIANPGLKPSPLAVNRVLTPAVRALLPVLGAFMLWHGLRLLPSEYYAEMARTSLRDHKFIPAIGYAQKGLGAGHEVGPVIESAGTPDWIARIAAKTGGNPNNPNLYFYMGEANRTLGARMPNMFLRQRYFEAAIPMFEAGLKVFPENESLLVRYAQALDGLQKHGDAEAIYQKALNLDPNLGILNGYYESHLALEGKKDEAAARAKAREQAGWKEIDPDQPSENPF